MAEDYISLIGEDGLKELDLAKKSAKELADIVVDTNSKIADMYSKLKSNKSFAEFNKAAGDAQLLLGGLGSGISNYEKAVAGAALAEKQLATAFKARAQAQAAINTQTRSSAEGLDSLKQSVRSIVKELPSLSGGIGNFFKAIADKLPGLIEQIGKAKQKNNDLAASGQKGVPVWQQLAGSIFSWQSALTVGITLLATYGDQLKDALLGTKDLDKATKKYSESIKNISENERGAVSQEIAHIRVLESLATSTDNTVSAKQAQKRAITELRKLYPQTLKDYDDEAIKAGKAKIAIDELTQALISKSLAQAAEKKFAATADKIYDLMIAQAAAEKKLAQGQQEMDKANSMRRGEDRALAQYFAQTRISEAKALKAGIAKELDVAQKEQAKFLKDSMQFAREAGKAFVNDTPDQHSASGKQSDNAGRIHKPTDNTRNEIDKTNAELARREVEADMKNQKAITDNEQASLDERMAARWQYHNGLIALAEMEKAQADKDNEDKHKSLLADIAGIQDKSEREKLTIAENERYKKQYYANIDDLAAKSNQAIADYAAQSAGDIEKTDKEALKQKDANLKSLVDAYAAAGSSVSETWQQHLDKVIEKLNVLKNSLQVFEQIGQLMKAINERNIQAIDKEAEENAKKEQKEIDAIKATVTNKDEAAQKIAEVEKRGQQQHELLEARKKKMQQDQARFEKAVSIVSIIAKTAEAVVAGLKVSPILAAAYGALGALQLATVIATPVPQYAEGTADHPGGPAIVGDGGEPELVVNGKKAYWSPAVATLVNLEKHAQVIPMHDMINASAGMVTARELAEGTWLNAIGPGDAGEICTSVDDMKYAVVNSLEKLNRKAPLKMIGNGFDSYIHKNL